MATENPRELSGLSESSLARYEFLLNEIREIIAEKYGDEQRVWVCSPQTDQKDIYHIVAERRIEGRVLQTEEGRRIVMPSYHPVMRSWISYGANSHGEVALAHLALNFGEFVNLEAIHSQIPLLVARLKETAVRENILMGFHVCDYEKEALGNFGQYLPDPNRKVEIPRQFIVLDSDF